MRTDRPADPQRGDGTRWWRPMESARTDWRMLRRGTEASLLELHRTGGRHAPDSGPPACNRAPVVGDRRYGGPAARRLMAPRDGIAFPHPPTVVTSSCGPSHQPCLHSTSGRRPSRLVRRVERSDSPRYHDLGGGWLSAIHAAKRQRDQRSLTSSDRHVSLFETTRRHCSDMPMNPVR